MESKRQEDAEFRKGMAMMLGIVVLCLGVSLVCWLAEHMFLLIGLIVAVVLCIITVIVLRHKRLMRQQDIDILKTNVSTISEDEADGLAKKYQEMECEYVTAPFIYAEIQKRKREGTYREEDFRYAGFSWRKDTEAKLKRAEEEAIKLE